MATLVAPYFPIIYVRGYAMTSAEIADAVSSPYMGFNVGATKLRKAWDGQVRRHVFESPLVRLMKDCGYRDIYADGAPEVAPMRPWPAPHDGFKLRHYRVEDYRDRPMRMFRSANLMINIFDFDGPRDIMALSPHSHADFEQGSFAMSGQWVHSLRYPWSKQLPDWREDEHLAIGSPSLLVIPATVIHTSRSTAPGNNQLVDIFSPPRRDFCDLGYVCNGAEYPVADTEGDKE